MKTSPTHLIKRSLALAAVASVSTTLAHATVSPANGVPAPVQAVDDPWGIPDTMGPVMAAGSSAQSAQFDQSVLPSIQQFIAQDLPEAHNNLNAPIFQIDPNKLVLSQAASVTATFIHDGGAFDSAVGVDVTTTGNDPANWWAEITSPTASLVFPNTGSTDSSWPTGTPGVRNVSQPVLPGDFVNMGNFAAGSKLDFFLLANGANNYWAPVFSADESLNEDGFNQHVAAFTGSVFAQPELNSPYVFLAFKDYWGGGDKDMNDVVMALNVGVANVHALLATPEPAMPLTFGACLGLAFFAVRKAQKNNLATNMTAA
jgi:hypothetical protein